MDIDKLFDLLGARGGAMYGREPVTQLEHALQCAALALEDEAGHGMITATLFHDIGHLVMNDDAEAAEQGRDLRHEEIGARVLERVFGPDVAGPVRLHVPAKRYLCAIDDGYFATLSPASVRSLEVQGGAYDRNTTAAFINQPYAAGAVQLRRWDDIGKIAGKSTPSLSTFRPIAEAALNEHATSSA